MNKTLFLVALLSMFLAKGFAQESKIENTQLQLLGDNLIITYDVVGSSSLDNVWLEIKTTSNKSINAKTLSGDIGKKILAGKKKKIVWNMKADGVDLQGEELNVKVLAFKPKSLANELADIVEIERGRQLKSRESIIEKNGTKLVGKLNKRFCNNNLIFLSNDGNNLTLNPDEIETIKSNVYSKDTIGLKNGDVISGTIKYIYPNDRIILRSKKNNEYLIQWTDIKSVSSTVNRYFAKGYFLMPYLQASDFPVLGIRYGLLNDWGYYTQLGFGGAVDFGIGVSKYIYSMNNTDVHAAFGFYYNDSVQGMDGYTSTGADFSFMGRKRKLMYNVGLGVPLRNGLISVTLGVGYVF